MKRCLHHVLRRFTRSEDGAALVEFAFVLPILLLFFAVTIEGGRLMWSYQAAIAGVRDATRYVGRTVPSDICSAGGSIAAMENRVTDIVRNTADGRALFPDTITVDRVVPTLHCYGGGYRLATTGVATVTADLTITWPFARVFGLFGGEMPTSRTQIADTGRVFGT